MVVVLLIVLLWLFLWWWVRGFICLIATDCLLLQFADWFGCFVVGIVFCVGLLVVLFTSIV